MADIDIRRSHSLGSAQARAKVDAFAKKMERDQGIASEWKGDTLHFHAPSGPAKKTTGTIAVREGEVAVAVELPLLLRGFKKRISSKIDETLDGMFGKG